MLAEFIVSRNGKTMIITGYKLNGYDATYRKATFNLVERGERVLEVTDTESGTTFILDFESCVLAESEIGTWRADNIPESHGLSIVFGSKGIMQQLKYGRRKRKMRTKGEAE